MMPPPEPPEPEAAAAPAARPGRRYSHAARLLEIPQVFALVEAQCQSQRGIQALRVHPFKDPKEAEDEFERVWHCRHARLRMGRFRFSCEIDPELLKRARIQGFAFEPEALIQIWDGIRSSHEAQDQLLDDREQWERFGQEVESLPRDEVFLERCQKTFDRRGEILDEASPELARLRAEKRRIQQSIESEMNRLLKSDLSRHLSEQYYTQKDGRWVLPIQASHKGRIPGLVVGSSRTGSSLYIEPVRVMELSNQMVLVEGAEAQEIRRILEALTRMVAERLDEYLYLVEKLADLDALQARAAFAEEFSGVEPKWSDDQSLNLLGARHPLLGTECHPIELEIPTGTRVLVLSGANAGGKTVAIKTLGVLTYLAQCGLHVPLAPGSILPWVGRIHALIGDDQSLAHHLSTFSSHVTAVSRILKKARKKDLVLLDELMSGTDPEEGASLALEVLEAFRKRGCLTSVTTHYSVVKTMASEAEGFFNACVEFDEERFQPTFRVISGSAGPSRGFAIAQRYGLGADLVERARLRLGPERARLEGILRSVETERLDMAMAKREVVDLRSRLKSREAELETVTRKLKEETHRLAEERARALEDELTELRRKVLDALEAGRVQDAARLVEGTVRELDPLPPPPPKEGWEGLSVGDRVKVGGYGVVGELKSLDPKHQRATVQAGAVRMDVDLTQLERLADQSSESSQKPRLPKLPKAGRAAGADPDEPVPALECHLVGMRAEEAREALEAALDDAVAKDFGALRVVHGFGKGVLRKVTDEVLKSHPLVRSTRAGGQGEGGRGATIALLG